MDVGIFGLSLPSDMIERDLPCLGGGGLMGMVWAAEAELAVLLCVGGEFGTTLSDRVGRWPLVWEVERMLLTEPVVFKPGRVKPPA